MAIEREPDRGAGTWIDALVLAREDPFDIGRRSRLSSPVVAAYCDCFFSVGEWIDDQAFVFDQVVRAEMSRGRPAVALRNATIKFVAYVAGSDGLAELFSTGPSQPQELWRPLPYMVQRVGLARDLESLVAAALPGTPNPAPADAAQLEALVARVRTVVRPAVAKTKLQREGARMGTPRHTDESPFRQTGPGLTL